MVCKKCGATLEDGSNYCIICDKYVDAIDETEVGMDKDDKSPFAIYNKSAEILIEKKQGPKKSYIVLVAFLSIVLIGVAVFLLNYEDRSYGKIVNQHYTSVFNGDEEKYQASFVDRYYIFNKDEIKDYYDTIQADKASGTKYSYKILSAKRLVSDQKDRKENELKEEMNSEVAIKEIYKVEVEVKREASKGTTETTEIAWAIKQEGQWYIYIEY